MKDKSTHTKTLKIFALSHIIPTTHDPTESPKEEAKCCALKEHKPKVHHSTL